MAVDSITPGFMLVQGNRTEDLRDLVVRWLRLHPLAPLEQEVFLVQSNGIAQWLKHALAANRDAKHPGCGIGAALDVMLPARLQWQAYRAVLGDVPAESPFDSSQLVWRLMRVLATVQGDVYAPLLRFLQHDPDCRKRYQLAGKLADLFDQYQVYRAAWLEDWEAGRDQLQHLDGRAEPVPDAQRWQPALWRTVVSDVPEVLRHTHRAAIHRQFMTAVAQQDKTQRVAHWPRRIVVFGISSLPAQTLEVLAGMANSTQVLFCVNNPCQEYWGDVVEGRELFRTQYRRQTQHPLAELPAEQIHTQAHPLLVAWGKQGRDYMRLLDAHDERATYEKHFTDNQLKIDLFDASGSETLLGQLQQDILHLRSLAARQQMGARWNSSDDSIRFHIAHSPQREVEILHDQLLAAFAADPQLKPRDIMVMVPDINSYAPHIEAVFGQVAHHDPRHIPFTIADQGQRQQKPLLIALEHLLHLDQSRFTASEVLDLLEVPAIRQRFGLDEAAVPVLHRWVRGAGIRWGLDAAQRASLGLPENMAGNSWLAGLKRVLLGYAVGRGEAWGDIESFDEIGGLEAALAGPLCDVLSTLEQHWQRLREPAAPAIWQQRLRAVLQDFFLARSGDDAALLVRLEQQLQQWVEHCSSAGFAEPLPLAVVRECWLGSLDQPQLSQRFLAGAVNFATLMPMRAIPFKRICLLGMNHADFPRRQPAADFDLMAVRGHYQPGDRSRREDDRYLFLEALLSAREQFYISWVGRHVKDNSERPPSVLVSQLRDHLASGWQGDVAQLTVEHPLQPFSRAYFSDDKNLFTYSHEWRAVHGGAPATETVDERAAQDSSAEQQEALRISLGDVAHFLANPAKAYFKRVLKVDMDDEVSLPDDNEPFTLNGLDAWALRNQLLQPLATQMQQGKRVDITAALEYETAKIRRAGSLPHAGFGDVYAADVCDAVQQQLTRYQQQLAALQIAEPVLVDVQRPGVVLEHVVDGLYHTGDDHKRVQLVLTASDLGTSKEPKYHHVVKQWPLHLAVCAASYALETVIVHAGEETLRLPPMESELATHELNVLLDSYLEGMQRPLPVACKTAFKWLDKNRVEGAVSDTEAACEVYDGGYNSTGEVTASAALARCWPDFHAMDKTGEFEVWAEALYRALYSLMKGPKKPQQSPPSSQQQGETA